MSDDLFIVPSKGDGFVELARTKTGRLFRKHLLNLGDLRHPKTGETVKFDDDFAKTLKKNFNDGVCDIVQIPLANEKNEHSEDPDRNIGEVVDLEVKDNKVYGILDVRDNDKADKLGVTLLGASAMLHMDYTDTKTGKKVGPTLLHACVTNRPYVTGLEGYEEIVAATADKAEGAVLLTDNETDAENAPATDVEPQAETPKEETDVAGDAASPETTAKPSLEELLTQLKTDHGIDVTALQAKAAETDQATQLSKTLVDALSQAGVVKLTNTDDKPSTEDVVGAVTELHTNNVSLTNRVNALEKRDAQHAVDALVKEGRVMPAQRDAYVELKLSNEAMFNQLVPAEPLIKLTGDEVGRTPPNDESHVKDVNAEIERYAALLK